MNGHLMASCVRNILTKNYQSLIIVFQVTIKNVGDVFFETQCRTSTAAEILTTWLGVWQRCAFNTCSFM